MKISELIWILKDIYERSGDGWILVEADGIKQEIESFRKDKGSYVIETEDDDLY